VKWKENCNTEVGSWAMMYMWPKDDSRWKIWNKVECIQDEVTKEWIELAITRSLCLLPGGGHNLAMVTEVKLEPTVTKTELDTR
jgi:hypothetical protein